ncbi:MAG: flippase [Nitrospira sp.]|nr:flippase [Nitrospira sp.]
MSITIQSLVERAIAHQGLRRYLFNTSWMFAEQFLRILAGVFVGIYVARYLGPEQFGVYSYALAFVTLFSAIARLGLDGVLVRDLVNHPDFRDVYLGTAFWLKVMGAVFAILILTTILPMTSSDTTTKLYIYIIASGLVFQSCEVVDSYFQSKVLSKYVSIAKLIQLILSSVLKLYFVFVHAELVWFVLVSLIDQLSLAICLLWVYSQQRVGIFLTRFDSSVAATMLRNCWPLILSQVSIAIYMRVDQVVIKELIGDQEVGVYAAAARISEAWNFIPVIVTNSLFPAILNAKIIDPALYGERLQRLYSAMVLMTIVVALPISLFSDWIVQLLYGVAYRDAGPVLMIHVWAGLFVALGTASNAWLLSESLQRIALYRTLSGAVTALALNILLIPYYGIVGAAIATVVGYMIAGLIFDLFNSKTRPMFFMKVDAFFLKGIRVGN